MLSASGPANAATKQDAGSVSCPRPKRARRTGWCQVCKAFTRWGHKNDDFLHKGMHSVSGL